MLQFRFPQQIAAGGYLVRDRQAFNLAVRYFAFGLAQGQRLIAFRTDRARARVSVGR